MPKVLNVEKLQKKFASLTRSRESIQSLSAWIMHHSEFHEDIVNQWLIGLSKDYNALVMFYVANDVIQNCGRKRVPEFREDFSKVLEKALAHEKVKEIKREVTRLLTFWKERDIYDEEFSQRLLNIVNRKEVKVIMLPEDEEVSELEVIARFKLENLVNNLKDLKSEVDERMEKEEILNYAEEPEMPDPDDFIVRKECHAMVKKCEIYLNLLQEYIDLTEREILQGKLVLKDLKDCCIFYSAQNRDVKEVANMFRIYGKKLKIMEKKVAEKKATLPDTSVTSSPCFSDASAYSPANSFSSNISPADQEDSTNVPKGMQGTVQSLNPVQEAESTEGKKSFFELLSNEKNTNELDKNVTTQLNESELTKHENKSFKALTSEEIKDDSNKQTDSSLPEVPHNQNENALDPMASTQTIIQEVAESNDSENQQKNLAKPQSSTSEKCIKETVKRQEIASDVNTLSQAKNDVDIPISATVDQSAKSNKKSRTADEGDINEIDFLLDESYDCKKEKVKLGYKRKIALLLSSKEKKQCSDAVSEKSKRSPEINDLKSPAKSQSLNDTEKPCKVEPMDICEDIHNKVDDNAKMMSKDLTSNISVKDDVEKEKIDQHLGTSVTKGTSNKKEDSDNENCKDMLSTVVMNQEVHTFNPNATFIGASKKEDTDNNEKCKNTSSTEVLNQEMFSGINTFSPNSTFMGADLNSYLSNVSTEFLKNIIEKNKLSSSDSNENKTSESALKENALDSSTRKVVQEDSQAPIMVLDSNQNKLDDHPIQCSNTSEKDPLLTDSKYSPKLDLESCEKTITIQKNSSESKSAETTLIPGLDSLVSDLDENASMNNTQSLNFEPKQAEELRPHEDNKEIQKMESYSSELSDVKPNLFQTLQSVLECISTKNIPNQDALLDATEILGPPIPFESCLKIYGALCNSQENFSENASKLSNYDSYTSAKESLSKEKEDVASNISHKDNFQVVDMECDSDENC